MRACVYVCACVCVRCARVISSALPSSPLSASLLLRSSSPLLPMSSYFVNSTFPVTLPGGGQAAADSFLGQIPLYSSGYAADPLRHYPGAAAAVTAAAAVAYGAGGVHQEKAYPASAYYQQAANGAYGGHRASGVAATTGAGACDYAASFYRDKDPAAAACGLEEHALPVGQDVVVHRKTECAGLGKGLFGEPGEEKQPATPIYPWMQRMNACNEASARSQQAEEE
ncbi:homeobox protein Hox-B6a [Lampris incognitus]|uniref:homeobox protein Hox-B6a n=1 Tax=Lampris incognitus TaxID=2546036 RepID=UPI0024B4DBAD|nr:homeobox protein Hox-B6a [Lampris incognitus]